MPFFVQKHHFTPEKPPKSPKTASWRFWHLSNVPKFLIRGFQNHRLLKTLKYSIFSSKIAEIAHETAKIARNRPKSPPGGYTVNNYAIWVEINHFCGKSEFPRGLML